MLFSFLKYTSPTNYFNLIKNDGKTVFPNFNQLPDEAKELIILDDRYTSEETKFLDASWQAIHKGYIGDTQTIDFESSVSLIDQYIFIRKYFSVIWVVYTLILRIITLHNPFREINAFLKTKNVKRYDLYNNVFTHNKWSDFQSSLLASSPKISVIIPTLNRYTYLKDVLKDLENQDYNNFDVIIVDQTDPYQEDFYNQFDLDIHVWHQKEKALWLARNSAIQSSNANYFLLFDDDSRVDSNWISNHIKCLDFFDADISSGTSISTVGAKVPPSYAFFKVSEQLDTGNVLIKREVFESIGLFDRQFEKQRMGDGEYGLRAYLAGFKNISNPYAERLHLKVGSGGLRQMGSWDAFRTKSLFSPRPIPSVLYLYRSYYGEGLAFFSVLKNLPISLTPYRYKSNQKAMVLGLLIGIVIFPLIVFQILKSYRLSSIKIKEGPLVVKI